MKKLILLLALCCLLTIIGCTSVDTPCTDTESETCTEEITTT